MCVLKFNRNAKPSSKVDVSIHSLTIGALGTFKRT